nr:MAG TPA: hypothetical protein [Caudoviricetes sp.]
MKEIRHLDLHEMVLIQILKVSFCSEVLLLIP